MSKGGGGGGSTTTVQKADPWVGLQPALSQLYGSAQDWYRSGGPKFYPGNTLADSNNPIELALEGGQNLAQGGPSPFMRNAANSLDRTANGRSMWENPASATMSAFGQGGYVGANPAQMGSAYLSGPNSVFGQFASGQNMGTNPAQDYFKQATGGMYLGEQNPYLRGMVESASRPIVDQFQNAIAPALASQFAAAGRTGSGAHSNAFGQATGQLGRALGDVSTNIYGSAYEAERGRQQGAANTLAQIGMSDRAQQLQGGQGQLAALGQLSNINQNDRAMQLRGAEGLQSAYGAERALQQQAALAAPQFESMKYNDLDKLLGIGEYRRGQQQERIDADRTRWDYNQQLPLQNLQALNQILQGGSVYAGSTATSNQQQRRNPFAGAIGGAAMSNALGGMFGGNIGGILGGPMGLLGGALLGGLFG